MQKKKEKMTKPYKILRKKMSFAAQKEAFLKKQIILENCEDEIRFKELSIDNLAKALNERNLNGRI